MTIEIFSGACLTVLKKLPKESVDCCVTSPPYWGLRDYGVKGQLGTEATPDAFIKNMVKVFSEVRRVLMKDGSLWLNMGDSYCSSGVAGKQSLDELGKRNGKGGGHKQSSIKCGRSRTPPGMKTKDLVGMPWMLALALRANGWFLRRDIIWSKPNPMPESVTDRPTTSHEYIFLLTKSANYYYDADAIREPQVCIEDRPPGIVRDREYGYDSKQKKIPRQGKGKSGISKPGYDEKKWEDRHDGLSRPPMTMKNRDYHPLGRNKHSVWVIPTSPFSEAHFATFPPRLIEPCILAGCPKNGTVLDPFFGAGTTGLVADRFQRNCIGIELNPEYIKIARKRLEGDQGMFSNVKVYK